MSLKSKVLTSNKLYKKNEIIMKGGGVYTKTIFFKS